MDRRGFLKGVIASGAAPMLFNGCATGFFANRRVNVAVVGYGRIAHTMDVPGVLRLSDRCAVTAICDVDARRAEYGKSVVEKHYAAMGENRTVSVWGDYRAMLAADPSIDAVMLCIPDHQHAIIALLAGENANLFMVGDEDQSIYGFRAAYPDALLSFETDHPGAKVLLMEENFRSDKNIVAMADRFISRNFLRHEKHMVSSREGANQVRKVVLKGRKAQYS